EGTALSSRSESSICCFVIATSTPISTSGRASASSTDRTCDELCTMRSPGTVRFFLIRQRPERRDVLRGHLGPPGLVADCLIDPVPELRLPSQFLPSEVHVVHENLPSKPAFPWSIDR